MPKSQGHAELVCIKYPRRDEVMLHYLTRSGAMTKLCKDADISVNPVGRALKVFLDGVLIGESANALALAEKNYPIRYYIPRADIDAAYLAPSDHTTHCPYKGDASYHHLIGKNGVAENAVWFYPDPCPLVEKTRDHLAFWGDRIEVV